VLPLDDAQFRGVLVQRKSEHVRAAGSLSLEHARNRIQPGIFQSPKLTGPSLRPAQHPLRCRGGATSVFIVRRSQPTLVSRSTTRCRGRNQSGK
jgi:hypothetical protein